MEFNKQAYKKQFTELLDEKRIVKSIQSFKIKLFLEKAENSILIAKHNKELKPNKDQPKRIFWDYWAITISYYSMLYAAKAAILSKGYEVKDHDAAQIALGHLLVPDEIEKEDLEILSQSYEILKMNMLNILRMQRQKAILQGILQLRHILKEGSMRFMIMP